MCSYNPGNAKTPKSRVFLAWVSGCGGKNKYHLIQAIAFVYGTPQAVVLKYVW